MSISFAAPPSSEQGSPGIGALAAPDGPAGPADAERRRWRPSPRNAMPAGSGGVPHVGALDGLRGLAVIAVLAYHQHKLGGGFDGARGGYLGVSAFFTLSGYLITNLLVAEHETRGAIALGAFWIRRIRRLLPAAVAALVLVVVYAWVFAPGEQFVGLRGDMLGALGYVANWRFLAGGTSYAAANENFSPVLHFWSLAIEEQFYVLWPLVVFAVLRFLSRRALSWVTGGLLVASVVASLVSAEAGASTDTIYFGTHTRAAELLVGAALALAFPLTRAVAVSLRVQRRLVPVGLVAAVVLIGAWVTVNQQEAWLYRGGFAGHAVVVAALMAAAAVPGRIGQVLAWRPLRLVGLVSYGLYLYHWPIYLVLNEQRTDVSGWPLFLLRMVVVASLATVSYQVLEQPIRRRRLLTRRHAWLAVPVSMAVAGAAIVGVTADPPSCTLAFCDTDTADAGDYVFIRDAPVSLPAQVPASSVPTFVDPATPATTSPDIAALAGTYTIDPADPLNVMIVGDSGTYDASPAISSSYHATGAGSSVETAFPGIGLTNGVLDWRIRWPEIFGEIDVDLVVVMLGGWDLEFLEANGAEAYGALLDEAVSLLTSRGAHVQWLSVLPGGTQPDAELNAVFQALAERHPGQVDYLDVAPVFRGPDDDYPQLINGALYRKPDGWHLCPAGAAALATYVHLNTASLGWSPLPVDGWQVGEWMLDRRYDDPPGGCFPPAE